jgi:quinol monooxygenase YgiN
MLSFSKLPDSTNLGGDFSVFQPLIEYIRKTEGCLNSIGAPTTQFGDGIDEKRFLIMTAWESIEAHERGKKAEGFATLSNDLWKKAQVHHVKWEKAEGSRGEASGRSML